MAPPADDDLAQAVTDVFAELRTDAGGIPRSAVDLLIAVADGDPRAAELDPDLLCDLLDLLDGVYGDDIRAETAGGTFMGLPIVDG